MSKSTVMENEFLKLVFNNTAMSGVGDTSGLQPSTTTGVFWITLHTADPGNAGNQATSEAAYTGYSRVAVARNSTGFTVVNSSVNFTSPVDFPECTANAGATITHFGIGDASTGAGKLRFSGTLTPGIIMAVGTIPRINTTANLITED